MEKFDHKYQHAFSCEKPSSESHTWSYKRACDACLYEIEENLNPNERISDILFEDLGRETGTHTDRWGARTWRCTHTVIGLYSIANKSIVDPIDGNIFIEESLVIHYKMKNAGHFL